MVITSSTILTFFIICGAITVGLTSAHQLPDDADEYLKRLPEKTRRLADRCTKKLTWTCAQEVAASLYTENQNVSKSCCNKVLGMGKKCSTTLLTVLINVPELKDKKDIILTNAMKLFKKCLGKRR